MTVDAGVSANAKHGVSIIRSQAYLFSGTAALQEDGGEM
jgi:hypothetical protein